MRATPPKEATRRKRPLERDHVDGRAQGHPRPCCYRSLRLPRPSSLMVHVEPLPLVRGCHGTAAVANPLVDALRTGRDRAPQGAASPTDVLPSRRPRPWHSCAGRPVARQSPAQHSHGRAVTSAAPCSVTTRCTASSSCCTASRYRGRLSTKNTVSSTWRLSHANCFKCTPPRPRSTSGKASASCRRAPTTAGTRPMSSGRNRSSCRKRRLVTRDTLVMSAAVKRLLSTLVCTPSHPTTTLRRRPTDVTLPSTAGAEEPPPPPRARMASPGTNGAVTASTTPPSRFSAAWRLATPRAIPPKPPSARAERGGTTAASATAPASSAAIATSPARQKPGAAPPEEHRPPRSRALNEPRLERRRGRANGQRVGKAGGAGEGPRRRRRRVGRTEARRKRRRPAAARHRHHRRGGHVHAPQDAVAREGALEGGQQAVAVRRPADGRGGDGGGGGGAARTHRRGGGGIGKAEEARGGGDAQGGHEQVPGGGGKVAARSAGGGGPAARCAAAARAAVAAPATAAMRGGGRPQWQGGGGASAGGGRGGGGGGAPHGAARRAWRQPPGQSPRRRRLVGVTPEAATKAVSIKAAGRRKGRGRGKVGAAWAAMTRRGAAGPSAQGRGRCASGATVCVETRVRFAEDPPSTTRCTVRTQYYLSTPIRGQCARLLRPAPYKLRLLLPHDKGAFVGEEDQHPVVGPRPAVPRPRGVCPCWQTRRTFLEGE
ncbi:hypothetical protein BU14_0284s0001 [Porphyra umbilicalis]|uniref:Uncharacterized protein n=1 Tax=Porphyra umbilicalis TaxID=2786 RepID=A0A1X6P138_PORUM|nr:hypothetical protein BU14_0284s0001 [Porphyra umbilicalis]|eukprot:OSX74547.1 hypothetical protein BU14_0284s0001 [Porphyra umbilicalis]